MYHIKADKRCLQSAQLIAEGLQQCLKEKEFTKITITDIQRVSGVGRSTFYRLFDDMADVLAFQCDQYFQWVYQEYSKKGFHNMREFARQFFSYWMERIQLLEVIAGINRLDILYDCHLKHFEQLKPHILVPNLSQKADAYYIAVMTGIMVSILLCWVKNGKKETLDEIEHILKNVLGAYPKALEN